jgi:solute carrier family 35 protein C2
VPEGRIALVVVAVRTLILVGTYFAFSIGLTFYQKNLIREFSFPLSVVVCHVIVKFILASFFRTVIECYRSCSCSSR